MLAEAVAIGIVSGYVGLVVAVELGTKAGPAVILVAGAVYIASVLFGRVGGIVWRAFPGRHLEA